MSPEEVCESPGGHRHPSHRYGAGPLRDVIPLGMRPAAIGAAMGVALLLRLWELGAHSLWLDELFTAFAANRSGPAEVRLVLRNDVHPPGYYTLMWAWVVFAGSSDIVLRLPSVIAGTLSVPLLAAVANQLFSRAAAPIAAWLLAVAPFAIQLSREARANSVFMMLALAATAVLLACRSRTDPRLCVAYGVLTAALAWTHVFGLFVILGHAGFAAVRWQRWPRDARRTLATASLLGLLSFMPWVGVLLEQSARFTASPWYDIPPGDTLSWLIQAFSSSSDGVVWILAAGWLLTLAKRNERDGILFIAIMTAAMVFVPLLLSHTVAPILRPRNVLPLLPLLLAGTAAGFACLTPQATQLSVASISVLVCLGVTTEVVFRAPAREMWRDVAALVKQEATPAEAVIANQPLLWTHYLDQQPLTLTDSDSMDALSKNLLWVRRAWVLVAHEQRPDLFEALPSLATIIRAEQWLGVQWARIEMTSWSLPLTDFMVDAPVMRGDDGSLHFYWNSGAVVALPAPPVTERCHVQLDAFGSMADGETARIAVSLAGLTEVLRLPTSRALVQTGPLTIPAQPASLELRFINDHIAQDGADRNAAVHSVTLRCEG